MIHREIFEHSPDCIFVTGVDDDGGFRLIDGNAAWEHLTGLDIARSRGHRLDEVVPAAYRGRLIERHHECLRRAGRFEYYGSMPAPGGPRRFHVTLTPVADAAGSFRRIIGVARDVTAVVAHRLSLLETALGQVREAVYLIDDQGRPHYVNDEACRMLGHERASLMGSAVWDIDPRWPPERWFRGWSELKALGRLDFETEHRRKDGRLVPVAVSASYVDYHGRGYELALVRDISERRRDQARLRESERRYRDVFDNVSDAVYLLEVTEDGRFRNLAVNPAFERSTGIPAAQLIGRCVGETVPPDVADVVVAKYRRCVAAGAAIEEEVTLDLPIGRRVYHSTLIPVRDDGGRIHRIIGASRDVTTSKRDEDLLRRRALEFRALVEHSPDTVARYDRECRRCYVNPALARAAGLPEQALLGLRPGEGLSIEPDIARRYEDGVRAVLASGQDAVFDLSWSGSSGEAFTSQIRLVAERAADGSVESVLAIGRDISSLMETQRQLRMLVEGHPDVVTRHDCTGRIVHISPASARRFGRMLSEYVGKTMAELDARYGAAFHASVRRVADTGLPRLLELPFAVLGELRYWEVRHVPEIGEHGRVTGVLGIARDITERRQNEQTIRELQQLREAAREEERRHIARELHDEMGQHLSALRMEVSLLRMRFGDLDPALREKTADLQTMVDHMIQITRDLMSSLRPAVLDIGIASALEWLAEEFRGPSGVTCRLHVDEASVALDSGQTVMVFRIVQEALTNVVRHAQASRVDVTLERRGADYLLMVRDDGRGFDPETRPRRSLGLVGLQERAQMLGGRLDIRSTQGAGTTISVTFSAAGAALLPQH